MLRYVVLITCILLRTVAAQSATLKRIATIELPGPRGQHFDHLAIDYDDQYLLSAYLTPGILYVIDTRTDKLVKAVHGLPGITAPVYVDGKHKVYTCDWGENKIGVVDLQQMKITKKLATKQKPNGGTYAAPFGKVYISDTLAKEIAVMDVHTDSMVKALPFTSETGMAQYDPVGRKIYANLRSNRRVAEIDPANDKVIATYPAGRCDFNHAMALDPASRRAFLLCGGNDVLAVFDLNAHRSIAYIPIASGGDDIAFDPGLRRIYVACESGSIAVIQEDDADHFRKLEDFRVPQGVHTLAVDEQTHRVYAPAAQEMGRPGARMLVFAAVP
ncbi:MAG TPA: YncE family protein [Terriglobales bacterium]|nr:YncE family protein [Terriglobales bacterium]